MGRSSLLILGLTLLRADALHGAALHVSRPSPLLRPRTPELQLYAPLPGETLLEQAVRRATAETNSKNIIHGQLGKVSFQASRLYCSWRSTVIQMTWLTVLLNTVFAGCIAAFVRSSMPLNERWTLLSVPDPSHPIIVRLAPLYLIWTHHSTLTTFILTFFVSESFAYWRRTLCHGRKIQRALVSILLLQSTHAARDTAGALTSAARHSLDRTASELRLLQIMFWASICRSKTIGLLHTPEGMRGLVERRVMSPAQYACLIALPECDRYEEVLRWVASRLVATQGAQAEDAAVAELEITRGSYDFERRLDDQTLELRDACHMLQTDLAGRMPLAYVHLLQILVDSLIVVTAPALYAKLGPLSVGLTFWVTVCYRGLLELSKTFLDALGLSSPGEQQIEVDVLISEANHVLRRTAEGSRTLPQPMPYGTPLGVAPGMAPDVPPPLMPPPAAALTGHVADHHGPSSAEHVTDDLDANDDVTDHHGLSGVVVPTQQPTVHLASDH